MEAWTAELEIEWDSEESILDNYFSWNDEIHKNQNRDTIFEEQLAMILGEDFFHTNLIVSAKSNTLSHNVNHEYMNNPRIETSGNNIDTINETNVVNNTIDPPNYPPPLSTTDSPEQICANKSTDGKESSDGIPTSKRRKRDPSEVQYHIMAERKRRELLTQRFIALSAIVPGLKKTDKTSVLGETIKYMQQLQERVKVLEEVTAKHTVESTVVVKKTKLSVNSQCNDDSSCVSDNINTNECPLPQIEVKVIEKNVLLKIYCGKQNGILTKLFSQVEKHCLSVVNTSTIPFGDFALDITLLAQMEIGFDNNVKELIRGIHSTLGLQAPST